MKKIPALVLAVFILIPGNTLYCKSKEYKIPKLNSKYICIMDYESGRVLFERDSKKITPMASTTKIMTAIIALEMSNINDVATVSKRASSIHGSTVGLKMGQKISMEELLYGLMLRSGNDCAIVIAEHIAGSVEKFAELMDSKAFDIGAFNTHFSTPHGLDGDGHFTTAYDLALITRYAMSNETFCKIVGSKNVTINGVNGLRSYYNINKILAMVEGADGVKTGYTGKAGKCLVSSASRYGRRVICVVLDSHNRWNDSKELLEYGLENFNDKFEIKKDKHTAYIDVTGGQKSKVMIGINTSKLIPISSEEKDHITVKKKLPDSLPAPVYYGREVGRLIVYSKDKEIYSIPYIAMENISISKSKTVLEKIISKFNSQQKGNE